MSGLTYEQCRQLRDARRAKGLTQSALARELACQQSAISMLEGGRSEALSQETIARLAALLGVTLAGVAAPVVTSAVVPSGRAYCPQTACPSNVPFAVNGEVIFWPRPQPGNPPGRHCAYCGEVLVAGCPACGVPVSEGGCCRACGAVLVPPPAAVDAASAEAWAAERRRQIAAWRALLT
jgi:transcriptional regulator with XRE-family HTH domain